LVVSTYRGALVPLLANSISVLAASGCAPLYTIWEIPIFEFRRATKSVLDRLKLRPGKNSLPYIDSNIGLPYRGGTVRKNSNEISLSKRAERRRLTTHEKKATTAEYDGK